MPLARPAVCTLR